MKAMEKNRADVFPADSVMYFPVKERKNAWIDRFGTAHEVEKVKSIVRLEGNEPVWLANVGIDYQLVENKVLYPHIEEHLMQIMKPEHLVDVIVKDNMSFGGRDCYREYIFTNLKCDIGGDNDISFRLIVGNSYGSKAVSLMYGAIDWWCSNGMIVGQSEKKARKHTSGLTLDGLDSWVLDGVAQFTSHGAKMWDWNHTRLPLYMHEELFTRLTESGHMTVSFAKEIHLATIDEANDRITNGSYINLFHLYSALTRWSTHGAVRETANDHEANTRIARSLRVNTIMDAATKWVKAGNFGDNVS
jgi:hypothetical protein